MPTLPLLRGRLSHPDGSACGSHRRDEEGVGTRPAFVTFEQLHGHDVSPGWGLSEVSSAIAAHDRPRSDIPTCALLSCFRPDRDREIWGGHRTGAERRIAERRKSGT